MTYLTPQTTPLFDVDHPTQQQIFDAVARHAAGMPAKSMGTGETGSACLYRTEDGCNACWIGGLVTDAEARQLEIIDDDTGIKNLIDQRPERVPDRLLHPELRDVLGSLQSTHDNKPMDEWPRELRHVARFYNLDAAIVDEVFTTA